MTLPAPEAWVWLRCRCGGKLARALAAVVLQDAPTGPGAVELQCRHCKRLHYLQLRTP